jgi:hypothetical protein
VEPVEVVVVGTHEYQWALWPFARFFAKRWGPDAIIYYGDRQEGPLPGNVEFRRVPCYSEGEWPWSHWFGNGLKAVLDDLRGFVVALFLPDHWLNGPVDLEGVERLRRYMDRKGNVLRGNLAGSTCLDREGRHLASEDGLEVVFVPPWDIHCGMMGGVTFSPALWNRALLRDLLEPHWNLWDCESLGTHKMKRLHPDVVSVGTRPALLSRAHGLYHGRPKVASLEGLDAEDREAALAALPAGWRAEG